MPCPAAVTIATGLSWAMASSLAPLGVGTLVHPALGLVLAPGQGAGRQDLDDEGDADALVEPFGEALLPAARILLGQPVHGHDPDGADIGVAGIRGEHDLIFIHLRIREHDVVDRLGPYVDPLDLLHVVEPADGGDLDAAEGPAAGAVAWL